MSGVGGVVHDGRRWVLMAVRADGRSLAVAAAWVGRWTGRLLVLVIRLYQRFISPMRPPTCRYYPSCSSYAVTALERHGLIRGTWLAARRLLRCHPWSPGGVDHVPERSPRVADRTAT